MTEPCLCWRSFHYKAKPSLLSLISFLWMTCAAMPVSVVTISQLKSVLLDWYSCAYKAMLIRESSLFFPVRMCGPFIDCLGEIEQFQCAVFKVFLLVCAHTGGVQFLHVSSNQSLNSPIANSQFQLSRHCSSASSECICADFYYIPVKYSNELFKKIIIVNHNLYANKLQWKGGTDTKQCCSF